MSDPEVDRSLAFDELTTSPVYRNLLVGESGDVTAVQVTLESNPLLQTLLDERELLRLQEQRGDIGDARTRLAEGRDGLR